MRRLLKNLGLSIAVLVVLVVVLEIVFRLVTGSPVSTKGQRIVHRREGEMEYALLPNLDQEYAGARVVTNSLGLRDYRPPHKSEDKEQIIVLGDSFTFGYGVRLEDSYPNILEQLLNDSCDGPGYEVINAGVPGYDTVDEAEMLKKIMLHYSPKWVIVGLHPGDFMSRQQLQKNPLVRLRETLRYKSAFFAWLQRIYKTKLIKYIPPPKSTLTVDPETVFHTPRADRIKQAFQDIRATATADGADMIVLMICPLIHWESYPYKALHTSIAQFCQENSIHFVDPLDAFSEYDTSSLWLAPNDSHYNADANRIAAKVLQRFLESADPEESAS
jgi:hypothetical protein